jgi:hypothetical protein
MLFCSDFRKKRVTFCNKVLVYLIPDRQIMIEYGMIDLLWWSDKDYFNFKKNVISENYN